MSTLPFAAHFLTRFLAATALLAAGLLLAGTAQAQINALVYDRNSASTQLAQVDAASGAVVLDAARYDGCCQLGMAVNAYDPLSQVLYTLGPDPLDSSQPWLLHALDRLNGSVRPVVTLSAPGRIVAAAFNGDDNELMVVRSDAAGDLELLALDTGSGVLSLRNVGLANCCALLGNAVVYSDGVVYLSARLRADPAPRLLRLPVDGSAADSVVMAAPLAVLRSDPSTSTVYGVVQELAPAPQSALLRLVQVDLVSGAHSAIGAGVADCCVLQPDVSVVDNGALTVVGNAVGESGLRLISLDLVSGLASFSAASVDSALIINGLFQDTKGLQVTTTSILSILPSPTQIGNNYTVSVEVSAASPVSGSVTVSDGLGNSCQIVLPAVACDLPAVAVGPLTVSAIYSGQIPFSGSSDSQAHTVVATPSSTSIVAVTPAGAQTVGELYSVSVSVSGFNPTGTVSVDDGAGASCLIMLPADSCMLTSTSAGAVTLSAAYGGDINNEPSSATAGYLIERAVSTTSITSIAPAGSSIVGDPYTVTVAISGYGMLQGQITVADGLGSGCLIVLPASSCQLSSSSAGAINVSASYGGDSNNLPSADAVPYTINQGASTTSIVSVLPAGSSPVGESYLVSVTVSGFGTATGSVSVDDGNGVGCVILLPADSCALTSVSVGVTTLTASYSGDDNLLPSADSVGYEIVRAVSTTEIVSLTPTPATVGEVYTVSVAVSGFGTLQGSVTVDDGDGAACVITLPDSSCDLVSLSTGDKLVTASYGGDLNNLPSADSVTQPVDTAESTTSIVSISPPASQQVGVAYDVQVSVAGFGTPAGTVTVDDGAGASCDIALPADSCQLTSTEAGEKTLTASYSGDVNNGASSDTASYLIERAESTTVIVAVTPPLSSVVGVAYSVEVGVSGFGTPAGSVEVDDGSGAACTIVLPANSCELTSTSAGPKTLTASYSGDLNNEPGSATLAYQIDRAASTTVVVAVTPPAPNAGEDYSVQVSVSGFGTPGGSVQIDDGAGAGCTITLPQSACSLNSSVAGNLTLSASYGGDDDNLPSADSRALSVLPATTVTVLSADPSPVIVSMPVTLTAVVSQTLAQGVILSGSVDFSDADGPVAGCSGVALVAGVAECVTSFAVAGDYMLNAAYSGDANNAPSSAALLLSVGREPTSTVLEITPASQLPMQPFVASISVSGGVAPLSGAVSLSANGLAVPECQGLMLTAGQASCEFRLQQPQSYVILAEYAGDDDDQPSTSAAVIIDVLALPIPALGPWALLLMAALMLLLSRGRAMQRMRVDE